MVVQVNDVGMVVQELRIGNYVNRLGKPRVIKTIQQTYTISYISADGEAVTINQIEPITLTEEILLKCGFVDGKIETENFTFSIHFYDGWNIDYKEKSGYGATEFTTVGFPALHQLQNLYFALTGDELNVNL